MIDQVRSFATGLDAYWKGYTLYLTSYGRPLARLRLAQLEPPLYYFDYFKWSTESYSSTYFGHDQKPLPLEEQLDFADGLRNQ